MKISSRIFTGSQMPEMPESEVREDLVHYAKRLRELGYDDTDNVSFQVLAMYCACYNAGATASNPCGVYKKPARGLLLIGKHGTGKSAFYKRFAGMMNIEIFDARDLAWEFQVGGAAAVDAMLRPHQYEDIIVDDVGNEDESRQFGNSFSMGTILDKRYRLWDFPGGPRTFLASNGDVSALGKLYGKATASRIAGMCDIVRFSGPDRRLER